MLPEWGLAYRYQALTPTLSCAAFLQNHIPVLSPALTDGSLGDMIFFHSYKNPGLVLDIVEGEALGPEEWGRRAGWAQGLTTVLFPRSEAHQH